MQLLMSGVNDIMVECMLKRTKEGSYRIFLPRLLVEEVFGVRDTTRVWVQFTENRIVIEKMEKDVIIDADEDVEVVE